MSNSLYLEGLHNLSFGAQLSETTFPFQGSASFCLSPTSSTLPNPRLLQDIPFALQMLQLELCVAPFFLIMLPFRRLSKPSDSLSLLFSIPTLTQFLPDAEPGLHWHPLVLHLFTVRSRIHPVSLGLCPVHD